ncbi:hypothetical protein HRbin38_00036 [bacterium HR38]|nr:hypothetical protein HRbin38_00036 [bacterium HR38]
MVQGEFYTRAWPTKVTELQTELDGYLDYSNRRLLCPMDKHVFRPHMALGGLAPLG